jgi:pimeloyl-ACP methyl ester carboxylesterase
MDHTEWRDRQDTVRLDIDGRTFDVACAEFDEGGDPTLFLHGIPTWSFLFRDVFEAVDHAIVPDFPGYGYTEHVGEGGYDRSIRVMEATARALVDELGHDEVDVVAHDLGGGAALRLAVNTDLVDRLVLSNAACYDSWPVEFIHGLGLPGESSEWTRDDVAEKLDFAFRGGVYGDPEDHAAFVDGMKAPFLDPAHEVTRLSRDAVSTNTNHTTAITPDLPDLDAETLLLWGGEDVLQSPEWADRLAEDLPTAEKRYLDEAYHWVMADRPDAYRDALADFLG